MDWMKKKKTLLYMQSHPCTAFLKFLYQQYYIYQEKQPIKITTRCFYLERKHSQFKTDASIDSPAYFFDDCLSFCRVRPH